MAALDITLRPANARPGAFTRLRAAFQHWADVRTTRDALNRLTDRDLDDIGLSRGDIERVARGN